jgi:hypothetical protein
MRNRLRRLIDTGALARTLENIAVRLDFSGTTTRQMHGGRGPNRPRRTRRWTRQAASVISAAWSWWVKLDPAGDELSASIRRARQDLGRNGWQHGQLELRPGRLTFRPETSVVVPGRRPFTIDVTRIDLLDDRPEPWGLSQLFGLDRQQLLLVHGADGRFHLQRQIFADAAHPHSAIANAGLAR